jgi:hypothetical protein
VDEAQVRAYLEGEIVPRYTQPEGDGRSHPRDDELQPRPARPASAA